MHERRLALPWSSCWAAHAAKWSPQERRRRAAPGRTCALASRSIPPASDVGSGRAFEIRTLGGDVLATSEAGERWTFRSENSQLRARSSAGREIGPAAPPLRIVPRDSGHVKIAGKDYRGSALIRVNDAGRLSAINVVDIEQYLLGVVPGEIGRLAPELIEAVKAQAIAARTYAIGNMNRWGAQGFDFVATVQDQVYGGVGSEDSVTSRAVRETAGEILTYDNKPILAYYSIDVRRTDGEHRRCLDLALESALPEIRLRYDPGHRPRILRHVQPLPLERELDRHCIAGDARAGPGCPTAPRHQHQVR